MPVWKRPVPARLVLVAMFGRRQNSKSPLMLSAPRRETFASAVLPAHQTTAHPRLVVMFLRRATTNTGRPKRTLILGVPMMLGRTVPPHWTRTQAASAGTLEE